MLATTFPAFYFEAGEYTGPILSREDWEKKILDAYAYRNNVYRNFRLKPNNPIPLEGQTLPHFGAGADFTGPTLGEWLDAQGFSSL